MRKKVMITGCTGLVGQNLMDNIFSDNSKYYPKFTWLPTSRQSLDLTDISDVERFIDQKRPDIIIHLAGRVGGIKENKENQISFLNENALMSLSIMNGAYRVNPKIKVITTLSSCIYPAKLDDGFYPLWEDIIEDGKAEETNEGYAVGKRLLYSLIKLYNREHGTSHVGLIPSNLYGPYDHFDSPKSHFLTALLSKISLAKENGDTKLKLLGDGTPLRQFTYVGDLVDAILLCLDNLDKSGFYNVATPENLSIRQMAEIALKVCDAEDLELEFSVEDGLSGVYRKDVSANKFYSDFGKDNYVTLEQGLKQTWKWYNEN